MTDQEKLKYFKVVTIVAVVVMTVMGVLIVYDNYKLIKAQNAYSQGWNQCAEQCNMKIDYLNSKVIQVPEDDVGAIPVILPGDFNESVGVNILITS